MPVASNSANGSNNNNGQYFHQQQNGASGMINYGPGGAGMFLNSCDVKQVQNSSGTSSINSFGQYRGHQQQQQVQYHNGNGGIVGGGPIAYNTRMVGKWYIVYGSKMFTTFTRTSGGINVVIVFKVFFDSTDTSNERNDQRHWLIHAKKLQGSSVLFVFKCFLFSCYR